MNLRPFVLLLILIGFGLRVSGLDLQPLWGDEGWSFYFASMPLRDMVAATAIDIHPPLYYALLHGWLLLAGIGPEVARFLSVVFGAGLIPVGYRFGRELLGPTKSGERLGLTFAAVLTAAPMAIYYSQEVRMYGLVTLLGLSSTLFFWRLSRGQRAAFWPYVILTGLLLYTEYYGVVIPLFHGVYWLLSYRKLHPSLRRQIFMALLVAGLTYLPWLIYAGPKTIIYVQGKTDVEGYVPLSLLTFLRSYLTAFSLGHLSSLWQPYIGATIVFGLVALLGLAYLGWRKEARFTAVLLVGLYLGVSLAIGWLINLVSPFTPPYFERTLLLAAPAWWLLIAAGLVWLWEQQWLLVGLVASCLVLINAVGLLDFYSTPRYEEQDYRPLLAKIAAIAAPEDVLLASYQWQLGFYQAYLPQPRPRLYPVPGWGVVWGKDAKRMQADLFDLLAQTVWFPAHQTAGRGWETQAEQAMAEIGYPALLEWSNPSTKLSLVGRRATTEAGPTFNFQNQLLAEVNLPADLAFESGRGIIPGEIRWTKREPLGSEHLVTLRLVDSTGEIWAARDSLPQAAQTSFIVLAPGDSLLDHHGLLIPAGTPPGTYQLRLSVTDEISAKPLDLFDDNNQPQGVEATLAEITVTPAHSPLGVEALAIQQATDWTFVEQLKLVGYSVGRWTAKTGETLPVNLFWQGLVGDLPDLTTFVQLQDEQGQALALTERPPIYPTTAWAAGTLLRDLHQLRLPATVPPGRYRLAAGILRPDKSRLTVGAADQVILGEVAVEGRPYVFDPPQPQFPADADFAGLARLIGYDLDLPTKLTPGSSLTLTLYWQSETDAGRSFDRNWTIFAHVVDADGHIQGQHDQLPGAGEFPTTSWVPGEFIIDQRQIVLNSDTPPGEYFINIGLYDANSPNFERLPVGESNSVTLERSLQVTAD